MSYYRLWLVLSGLVLATMDGAAQEKQRQVVPHNQKGAPNKAYTPQEAIQKMQVPEGFSVEVVVSEPDLVNPVAFTFDEKGRIWVVESLEYPRSSPGVGKDRVKVLEDTNQDGKVDKVTVFAEGLNIPSGIAVGHGGVWVANSPDILFLKDTDGDGKADYKEVVVTGFGRDDTHELPNSLTFGPDGWLYGYNGVFNQSVIKHQGKEHRFTCALFRIHPKTREFELFAEGVSNPWGLAFDTEGSAFASACVIDHLWHLVESGYYHRQAGVYPPFTWKLGSIVKHKHQMAAYSGLHFFDSDAYPPEYREVLYMGNIHGGGINADKLERAGSSYFAKTRPDFLMANDAWFMPVSQKTGPDGCLYILDWYDQYHCYQDARRDPQGIDRLYGRIYRVRYKDTPRAPKFDLAKDSDEALLKQLGNANVYFRDSSQRVLTERLSNAQSPGLRPKIEAIVLDEKAGKKARMHALWVLVSSGPLPENFHLQILNHKESSLRAWGVRAAGNTRQVSQEIRQKLAAMAGDSSPDVKLQLAVVAKKITALDAPKVLSDVLANAGNDGVIPNIVWQNLHPMLDSPRVLDAFLATAMANPSSPAEAALLERMVEKLLALQSKTEVLGKLLSLLIKDGHQQTARQICSALAQKIQTGEIRQNQLPEFRKGLESIVNSQPHSEMMALRATWGDSEAIEKITVVVRDNKGSEQSRGMAFEALVIAAPASAVNVAVPMLKEAGVPVSVKASLLSSLGRVADPTLSKTLLEMYAKADPNLQPRMIEFLSQRKAWANDLLDAIESKKIPKEALGMNQARRIVAERDPKLRQKLEKVWGAVREGRNQVREQITSEMRDLIVKTPGDAKAGRIVFNKVCGQCHKMHGEGQEVGPDITVNGRASFEQLLSNVFDPSLVIGADYQAVTVSTTKGRVLTGLLVEDSKERISLKVQGGKIEIVPRAEVEEMQRSKVSLMPEGLEKQIPTNEIRDLFAYLLLDKPPEDPKAKKIPGAP